MIFQQISVRTHSWLEQHPELDFFLCLEGDGEFLHHMFDLFTRRALTHISLFIKRITGGEGEDPGCQDYNSKPDLPLRDGSSTWQPLSRHSGTHHSPPPLILPKCLANLESTLCLGSVVSKPIFCKEAARSRMFSIAFWMPEPEPELDPFPVFWSATCSPQFHQKGWPSWRNWTVSGILERSCEGPGRKEADGSGVVKMRWRRLNWKSLDGLSHKSQRNQDNLMGCRACVTFTLSSSAIARNELSSFWVTLTSAWYMKLSTDWKSVYFTPFRYSNGCWCGFLRRILDL